LFDRLEAIELFSLGHGDIDLIKANEYKLEMGTEEHWNMDVGTNFNKFDFKRAGINFIQVFFFGYAMFVALLFSWSAMSEYGLQRTLNDLTLDLLISPIFWFIPALVGLGVAVLRSIRYEDFDATDPAQLEAYFEARKFSNQPK
jgi:hypothetical protein